MWISETGRYVTQERFCCPPSFQEDGGTLPVVSSFLADVELAPSGPFASRDAGSALGDNYGEVTAFTSAGTPVLIRRKQPAQPFQFNEGAAATRLRATFNALMGVPIQ